MADEWTLNFSLALAKGEIAQTIHALTNRQWDMSGNAGGNPGYVEVGTTEENINFGDITGNGVLLIINLGSESVQWGIDASGIQAVGEISTTGPKFAFFEIKSGVTLRMQSLGAAAVPCWIGRYPT